MILRVIVRLFLESIAQAITVSDIAISSPPEMSPMLATEGNSDKTATHTPSQQCVKGTGARGRCPTTGSQRSGQR